VPEYVTLTDDDDGKLFVVQVINTGERRIARYHCFTLAGRELRFPCFADPDNPEDYLRWVHSGNALAVSRADRSTPEAKPPASWMPLAPYPDSSQAT
jgi:hypothetical protein